MSELLKVDTKLAQLNVPKDLRTNSSFMKVLATLFHYGNRTMGVAQLALAIRALKLLPQREKSSKNSIQGIIDTALKQAKELNIRDPLDCERTKNGSINYTISKEIMNGVEPSAVMELPETSLTQHPYPGTKRSRKATSFYTPSDNKRINNKKKTKKVIKRSDWEEFELLEQDSEDDFDYSAFVFGGEQVEKAEEIEQEDTIADYSLLYSPPTADMNYIDKINFNQYPIAAHFAIVQQKGYSYPRFRSHDKIKIPKVHCEDKFRVTDIERDHVAVGRLFIIADGHGGQGCSEYFVRHTPEAVRRLCQNYEPKTLANPRTQDAFHSDIQRMIERLDEEYLDKKRQEMVEQEDVDNDGCTLILNIFLGDWLINVNVGDSRTLLISAPNTPEDYKMDVIFASQDHKPYLEHLAREILENGGEFVDSVQNRVIKVDVDKLREDNRLAKRAALKNARIRPKETQEEDSSPVPSLNVARSCGDLDFKMDPKHKVISCKPDVSFMRIKNRPLNGNKEKQRHFLFMSTDGTFDYLFEETPERQNRAIARMIAPMIEEGERMGKYLLKEEENENECLKNDRDQIGYDNARVVIESMDDNSENTELPRIPLLYHELSEDEITTRKIKERTLVHSARFFANREGAQGFFASTLQDYDDCTIILVEI